MARKKYGPPRAKFGEIKVKWGYTACEGEDFFACWGGQAGGKRASRLLLHALHDKPFAPNSNVQYPSLIESLEEAGYDTRTLVISCQMKESIIDE